MTTTTDRPVIDILDREFWRRNPHDAWTWARAVRSFELAFDAR